MLHTQIQPLTLSRSRASQGAPAVRSTTDWRDSLPVIESEGLQLRELRVDDGLTLGSLLRAREVTRYIAPPPVTASEFTQFVEWTRRVRSQGRQVCFGVVPAEVGEPVGLFQVWRLDRPFEVAEWGFALGHAFWGTGLYQRAAELVLEFAFDTLGVHRLEGRAAAENGRGNGALRKIGAQPEALLRRCFKCDGRSLDHVMWAIFADEWRQRRG